MNSATATEPKTWSILALIEWSSEYLSSKKFESPRLTVELMLAKVLGFDRIGLYTHFDQILTPEQLASFKGFLTRKLSHEPVQYIVGETSFMGLRFFVDSRVLIPRPETEILVEQVISHCKASASGRIRILDIGTGSGNIAVSLAKLIPGCEVLTLDTSAAALAVAGRNIEHHAVGDRVRMLQTDFLKDEPPAGRFDIVVSNPPYISRAEFKLLPREIREYEPPISTTDDADGLTFYRRIAGQGAKLLDSNGWLFVEVAYDQAPAVRDIFSSSGFRNIGTIKDYSGIERIVKAQFVCEP